MYLSDELVGLSLFLGNVSPVFKSAIVKGLIREPGKKNVCGDSSILAKPDVSLGDFATTMTLNQRFISVWTSSTEADARCK